jgi:hypothetical protein
VESGKPLLGKKRFPGPFPKNSHIMAPLPPSALGRESP